MVSEVDYNRWESRSDLKLPNYAGDEMWSVEMTVLEFDPRLPDLKSNCLVARFFSAPRDTAGSYIGLGNGTCCTSWDTMSPASGLVN